MDDLPLNLKFEETVPMCDLPFLPLGNLVLAGADGFVGGEGFIDWNLVGHRGGLQAAS